MGIDLHVFNFLRFASKRQPFGCVATIGRQGMLLSKSRLARLTKSKPGEYFGSYCEPLLMGYFGASSVQSFDNSDYERATFITDMNKPLMIEARFDTVIDGGCIEHIYNVVQALKNVSQMCSEGGQILHILPANNFCGHGFWQFSPEVFFSLYSETHGYSETQVFLADLAVERFWYEVKKPENGQRANVTSSTPVYALVRTRKTSTVSHDNVQQSDYVHTWTRKETESATSSPKLGATIKKAIKTSALESSARALNRKWASLRAPSKALSNRNPNLVKLAVSALV